MIRRIVATVVAAFLFVLVFVDENDAFAQSQRRRFEPTDLNFKGGAGTIEVSVQTGVVDGDVGRVTTRRLVAPDVETSVVLSSFAQIQLDTTVGFDEGHGSRLHFLENAWASLKLGIVDGVDPGSKRGWVAGAQAGPRLPTTTWSRGMGFESIAIVGRLDGRFHLFVQAGFLIDAFFLDPAGPRYRPFALEGGLDLDVDLDSNNKWSLKSELGGAHFVTPSEDEIHLTAGIGYNITKWLELTAVGIGGVGSGDRIGFLIGASPRFNLFR